MAAIWRLSRKGEHGSANGSVTDGIISFNIIEAGQPVWAGTISVLHLTLLVALPPLALWVAWLLITSRTNNADEIGLKSRKEMRELHATEHRFGTIDTSSTFPSKRREREES